MRKIYWYLSSYTRKHGLIVVISLVAASIFFWFLVPFISQAVEIKPRRYIGMVGDYSLTDLPVPVQELMSSGLTLVGENGSATPELSERWSIEENGTQYRFIIKKNLFWQDGKAFEPSDIQYAFEDVQVLTTANDIIFKLPAAFVPFPNVVSQPIFRPGTKRSLFFFERPILIGMGEYEMTDYKRQGARVTEITLDSPDERKIYRFFLTEEDAVLAFKRGEVDIVEDLASARELGDWPTVAVTKELDTNRYLAVFFNIGSGMFPKNIRQALSYAARKPEESKRAIGPISMKSWAYLEGSKSYDYDLVRAVERLLSEPPAAPLAVELTTTPTFAQEAEALKVDWEELGNQAEQTCSNSADFKDKAVCANAKISVTIKISSFPDTSNFQLLLVGQESPLDPDQYFLWHSGQPTNFSGYENTRIDSLLEKGRTTQTQADRLAIYQEFQQFFLEDAPAVFLRYLENYEVKRK
ncbi:MAG: hypothetical protein M3Q81_01570 [bacterium]|nr:hypothetical protein [bacterium]